VYQLNKRCVFLLEYVYQEIYTANDSPEIPIAGSIYYDMNTLERGI